MQNTKTERLLFNLLGGAIFVLCTVWWFVGVLS